VKQIKLLLVLLVAALSGCAADVPENWGVLVDGKWIPVVDVHTHTGSWDQMPPGFRSRLAERVPKGFTWTMGPVTDWMLGADNILGQMNNAGIYGAGIFATISPNTTGIATTDFMVEKISGNEDRMYGFAAIRTDRWNVDSAARLEKFEQELATLPSVRGVKMAHAHQQVRFDDERFYPIYELAGRYGKPMYLHSGTSPNPGTRYEPEYADPMYLEEAIQKYPDAIFILGHTGYDSKEQALTYTDSAIYLAQTYANVYVEPGALGAERAAEVIDDYVTRLKEGNVLHKVIYGSDGVQFPGYLKSHLEAYVAAMERNGYTAADMTAVLSGNFARVFGIEIPGLAELQASFSAGSET
jgi:predicted TIM-barrel fold metal-dependent hydrolase